ncbi:MULTISPECIES: hypothetical protein [Bacillaceae]|uniref:hypothetical protein n=2 Tax=Bacillales TaxID=1385 RepID=UPI0004E2074E|nr:MULTISPECIES: hypothetical protein [Bacillaceae]MCM3363726.1 hypothetical protein [Niallia sp. MER TA 168]CAI9391123.1 hypothetical protein BACSP_02899 [Bacillus sp. T2.9-1]
MFKSEMVNRIVSLVGFWIVVLIVLFSDNSIGSSIYFWGIVVVFTAYDVYRVVVAGKKNNSEV